MLRCAVLLPLLLTVVITIGLFCCSQLMVSFLGCLEFLLVFLLSCSGQSTTVTAAYHVHIFFPFLDVTYYVLSHNSIRQ